MIVHLFPKSKFTEPFINFLMQNFDSSCHEILLYENGPHDLSDILIKQAGIFDIDKKDYWWLYRKLKKADKIIFHNLSVNIDVLLFLFLHKDILKKSIWFIWGSDLYCYREKRSGLIEHGVEFLRKKVIQTIPVFASWITEDCRLANKWYKAEAINMPVAYYDDELVKVLLSLEKMPKKHTNKVKILVGNSATKSNNHIEVLDFLKKWAEDNIEIYAPLSYGDTSYGNEIQAIGESYFGQRFKAIRTYMSRQDYFSLLNEMDVVIFNHDRQQALGNIVALLYLGKKIYMRNNTTMWNTLVNDMGFRIYTIEDFKRSNLSELKHTDEEIVSRNKIIAQNHYDLRERVKEWGTLFSL